MAELDLSGKPWWQSQTMVSIVVSVVIKAASVIGYTLDASSVMVITAAMLSIGADIYAAVGRIKSTKVISKTEVLPGISFTG